MDLVSFVRESNRIEGIFAGPSKRELDAHVKLLSYPALTIMALEEFVSAVAPGHKLRRHVGLDVRVGSHIAPKGCPGIVTALEGILNSANAGEDSFLVHQRYENLHPFTDGNGRSGRAIWLWMEAQAGRADRAYALGFLHNWYYLSLQHWHEAAKT